MNKNIITNALALFITITGYLLDNDVIFSVGLFAVSGALTNWLAVHMLFEKVPGLYGSGIITIKFEQFKAAIRTLILEEFFSEQKLVSFLEKKQPSINFEPIVEEIDLNPAFDKLLLVIEESQFGAMLAMFGGTEAVQPLREPFITKMKGALVEMTEEERFKGLISEHLIQGVVSDNLFSTVEKAVDDRLAELTPKMVKEIMQNMIKTHLGWLVVWGGVFGGLFGLISSLV